MLASGRSRRFSELSVPRFAALGALGGLLLTLFPFFLVAVGLASTEGSAFSAWEALRVLGPTFILLGAVSAAVTLTVARKAEKRELLDAAEMVDSA